MSRDMDTIPTAHRYYGFDEDETVDEMEQMAESIGMTLEDAYEYAEEYRNREEEASYGYGY